MAVIELKNISKVYPGGIVAVDNVELDVETGEVHALLGENGAGKTTLVKIMSGCLKPTSGSIYVDGRRVEFSSPAEAMRYGIGMLHQHFTLIPSMSVIENIKLGLVGRKLKTDQLLDEISRISKILRLNVDLEAPVYTLSIAEKQKIEILRMMIRKTRILIFDEPTSSLCEPDAEKFLQMLVELSAKGFGIVFITHKLREAITISDRITIMRRGKVVSTLRREEILDEKTILQMMLGEHFNLEVLEKRKIECEKPVLTIKDLVVKNDQGIIKVNNVSFTLYRGEILGIIGVEGSGQKELVETIAGLRKPVSGQIIVHSNDDSLLPSYIPEERLEVGVAQHLDVLRNAVLRDFERREFKDRFGLLDFDRIEDLAKKIVQLMDVKTPNLRFPVRYLSGGNIQKLIVGRELIRPCEFLIAEQPTLGLDARSAHVVKNTLIRLASKGVGILLVSYDMNEILELSHRIAIMRSGKIVKTLNREEVDPHRIGLYMLTTEAAT